MGQKVHPIGFRLGYIKTWSSQWYAEKGEYPNLLLEDVEIRNYLARRLAHAAVSKIEIKRAADKAEIIIYTARPGIVIGRKGAEVESMKRELKRFSDKEVIIDIEEVRQPAVDAQLVAQNVAQQIEKRVSFRRAMKKAVLSAMKFGAKGIKIQAAGRLGGAEMARKEWYREGRVPLQTIRADIDYGFAEAKATYGVIGVKVWIFRGEVIK